MPGGDGTGPMGTGPMTGRAAGYCAGYNMPGYMNPTRGGFGRGRGLGRGWGRGFGRGRGRGRGWFGFGPVWGANPYAQELAPQQEADMLKEQAKAMQEEIKWINDRITDLESFKDKAR